MRGALAAVVSAPEEPVRGIVLELPGGGTAARIGSALAARLAPRFTELGLACVRFDYLGLGDSPGSTRVVSINELESGIAQARSLLELSASALGVNEFGVVGTCYGSRIALSLMEDENCVGAVCLASPMVHYSSRSELRSRLKKGGLSSLVASSRRLRQIALLPARKLLTETKLSPVVLDALEHVEHAPLLFLVSQFPGDHYSKPALAQLEAAVATLPPALQERLSVRLVPHGPLTTFGVLPADSQEAILSEIVDWIVASFDSRASAASSRLSVA